MIAPEFVNCKSCKKLFAKYFESYCQECAPQEDEYYRIVRDYLYRNPNSSVGAVVAATGINQGRIFDYISEGRITAIRPSDIKDD